MLENPWFIGIVSSLIASAVGAVVRLSAEHSHCGPSLGIEGCLKIAFISTIYLFGMTLIAGLLIRMYEMIGPAFMRILPPEFVLLLFVGIWIVTALALGGKLFFGWRFE